MPDAEGPGVKREHLRRGAGVAASELIVAWRTSLGTRLVIAFPGPSRFSLPPDESLEGLDEQALVAHLETAARLTDTEATFLAPDGRRWLAQAVGPVWTAAEGAESTVATCFTSLDGPYERFQSPGSPLQSHRPDGRDLDAALTELWIRARGDAGEAES
jgi:hypothetical protein